MSGKFTAQQFCIRPCDYDVHLLSQQTVHKQIPFRDILDLVNEQIVEISIYFVKHFKHIVQIISCHVYHTLVVEVDISEFNPTSGKRVIT